MSSVRADIISKDHQALSATRSRQYIVRMLEFLNASIIFGFFLQNGMAIFLTETVRFIFFPAVIALNAIKIMYLVRQAQLENRIQGQSKAGTVTNILFEIATTVSIATAIIGSLLAPSVFVLLTPVMLVTSVAAKAIFDFAKGMYYLAKATKLGIHARTPQDEVERSELNKNVSNNFLSALTVSVIATAIAVLCFSNLVFLGAVGLAAGMLGLTTAAWLRRDRATVTVRENSCLEAPATAPPIPLSTNAISTQLKVSVITSVTIEYGESYYYRITPSTDLKAPAKNLFAVNKNPIVSSVEQNGETETKMVTYRPSRYDICS